MFGAHAHATALVVHRRRGGNFFAVALTAVEADVRGVRLVDAVAAGAGGSIT